MDTKQVGAQNPAASTCRHGGLRRQAPRTTLARAGAAAKSAVFVLAVLLLGLAASTCGGREAARAHADMRDARGKRVGTAEFTPTPGGMRIDLYTNGLPVGSYGFRIHGYGECDPPFFLNAGSPLFPSPRAAGLSAIPADLGTLKVTENGVGQVEITADGLVLGYSNNSLFRSGGTSLVIHPLPSQAGDSSSWDKRVACGVIYPGASDQPAVRKLPEGGIEDANTPRDMDVPGEIHEQPRDGPPFRN